MVVGRAVVRSRRLNPSVAHGNKNALVTRRLLVRIQSERTPRRVPRHGTHRLPQPRCRVPRCPDAHPLSPYILVPQRPMPTPPDCADRSLVAPTVQNAPDAPPACRCGKSRAQTPLNPPHTEVIQRPYRLQDACFVVRLTTFETDRESIATRGNIGRRSNQIRAIRSATHDPTAVQKKWTGLQTSVVHRRLMRT